MSLHESSRKKSIGIGQQRMFEKKNIDKRDCGWYTDIRWHKQRKQAQKNK